MLRAISDFFFRILDLIYLVLYWGFALLLFFIIARQDYILASGMLEFHINVNQTFWYILAVVVVFVVYVINPMMRRFFGR